MKVCVVDTLHWTSLAERSYMLDLSGPVCRGMCTSGARRARNIKRWTIEGSPYEKQTSIISFGPFDKWGIDAIGPLPMAQSGKQYIIVGVDYMIRWTEATATTRITAKDVAKFVFENICCRFGTPLKIISNRGPGFRGDLVGELMEQLGVSRQHSSPYYPQCNGLVEKVNGMICRIITK
ncbi:hypothetical protein L7F22_032646 [Adiantum nelumboides]|nr:hypothetical protein [Adiantum nelumboides]